MDSPHCYKDINFLNEPKQLYLKPESAKFLTVGPLQYKFRVFNVMFCSLRK
jgi:hypothetical protein